MSNVLRVPRLKYTPNKCYTLNKYHTPKIISLNLPLDATTEVVELPSGKTLGALEVDGESPESPDGEGSPGKKRSSGLGRKARKSAEMAKIKAHAAGEIQRGPSKAERIAKEAERKSSTLR